MYSIYIYIYTHTLNKSIENIPYVKKKGKKNQLKGNE
jgi:hypothetical protein